VVTDETGDRWVGAGDKSICRMLTKSAAALVLGDYEERAFRLRALRTLHGNIDPIDVATYAINVPGLPSNLFVTGVGKSNLLLNGVEITGAGSERIIGVRTTRPVVNSNDPPDIVLNSALQMAFHELHSSSKLAGDDPKGWFGIADDRVYMHVLDFVVKPVIQILEHSGVVVDDLWANFRWKSRETRQPDGSYVRTFELPVREPRTRVQLGNLDVHFAHRHDRFEVPLCPRVVLRWR